MLRTKIRKGKNYDELSAKIPENMLEIYCEACENMGWTKESAYKTNGSHVLLFTRKSNIRNKSMLNSLQKDFEHCFEKIRRTENSIYTLPALMSATIAASGFAALWFSVVSLRLPGAWALISLTCIVAAFMLWFFSWAGYLTYKNIRKEKAAPVIRKSYERAMKICEEAKALTKC